MHPVEIKQTLDSMIILVDTREQETNALKKRLQAAGKPWERVCLPSGDYSAKITMPDGKSISFSDKIAIERKMSLDEICGNFTKGRDRFKREFERMKESGGRMYIIIENATWENVLSGKYRSQFSPAALTANILAWSARYNTNIIFCKPESTGKLIYKTLYYEIKEFIENNKIG